MAENRSNGDGDVDPSTSQPGRGGRADRGLDPRRSLPVSVTLQRLDPSMRSLYATSWQRTQEKFAQAPESALSEADKLVALLMDERGYPTEGAGRVRTDVSSDPAGVLDDYVAAHRIASVLSERTPTTQELRKAMDAYRRMVKVLLDDRPPRGRR